MKFLINYKHSNPGYVTMSPVGVAKDTGNGLPCVYTISVITIDGIDRHDTI